MMHPKLNSKKLSHLLPVGLLAMPPITLSNLRPKVEGAAKVDFTLRTMAVLMPRA